ncbi:MAG: hypothetical protein AB7E31_01265 [Desulfitobacterium sp.]
MKKYLVILLAVSLFLMGANPIMASSQQQNTIISPQAYITITGGNCAINSNGDGTINISGSTTTVYPVDKIGLTLHLQYLSGGSWYNLNSYTFSDYESAYISASKLLRVSSGFYYRVVAEHTSLDGAINERGQSYTSMVYVP